MVWQMQEAKQKFSEVVRLAVQEGDQEITYRGEEIAWLISAREYHRLKKKSKSLIDAIIDSPCQEVELHLERSKERPRSVDL